jgi:DNA-binding CsgD family transcriptional regulator
MPGLDEVFEVIEGIYAAGIDPDYWPKALAGVVKCVGGNAATMEVIDRKTFVHREFFSFQVPDPGEIAYLSEYAALSPRIPAALKQKPGDIAWDYQIIGEREIDGSPFYSEFLSRLDMRYAIAGILSSGASEFAAVAVQRSGKQGHVGDAEIAMMERLAPHIGRSLDLTRRLKGARDARHSLEQSLEWLNEGVALLRADGALLYANLAMQKIARADDGIRLKKGLIEFSAPNANSRFSVGVRLSALRGRTAKCDESDFAAQRPSGKPSYLVSVRSLPKKSPVTRNEAAADAIIFVRDPLNRQGVGIKILRSVFGLTAAEASLASALCNGLSPVDYAHNCTLSLNTVYTHLRRIKQKTGCKRMGELIRKLDDLHLPSRAD